MLDSFPRKYKNARHLFMSKKTFLKHSNNHQTKEQKERKEMKTKKRKKPARKEGSQSLPE